ncbi:MAG TPA: hypothetical protein VF703_16965 [Pyrinomonadaceae bacterium]
MWTKPERAAFTARERKIIETHRTPEQVQRYLSGLAYNRERGGGTLRSVRTSLRLKEVHCLEAALVAAAILEQHGHPPLLLSLESQDKLDHVVFPFRRDKLWGAIARSRDTGLHGRLPVFRNVRQLAWSYFDPYVDYTARVTGYGVANLYDLGNYDWRFSGRNVWKVERYLQELPHRELKSSERRYRQLLARFEAFRQTHPTGAPEYFDNRDVWMR